MKIFKRKKWKNYALVFYPQSQGKIGAKYTSITEVLKGKSEGSINTLR